MLSHLWWSAKAVFVLLCIVYASLFALWIVGVIISAIASSRSPQHPTRRRGDHRVGGMLK